LGWRRERERGSWITDGGFGGVEGWKGGGGDSGILEFCERDEDYYNLPFIIDHLQI
jgi:hypothetical protein